MDSGPTGDAQHRGFLVTILIGLTLGQHEGQGSPSIHSLWISSCGALIAFIVSELRVESPEVELRPFKNFNCGMGSIVNFTMAVLLMSSIFLKTSFCNRLTSSPLCKWAYRCFHTVWCSGWDRFGLAVCLTSPTHARGEYGFELLRIGRSMARIDLGLDHGGRPL